MCKGQTGVVILGRIIHSYLFVELNGGEVGLSELSVNTRRREEGRACLPILFLGLFLGSPYELIPLALLSSKGASDKLSSTPSWAVCAKSKASASNGTLLMRGTGVVG